MPKPRILLADSQPAFRRGVRDFLEKCATVVAESADGRQALALAKKLRPDIVLTDIYLPLLDGLTLTLKLQDEVPGTRVIVVSHDSDRTGYWSSFRAGAAGYVLKNALPQEYEDAVRQVMNGAMYISDKLRKHLRRFANLGLKAAGPTPLDMLTFRQREVLELVAEGQTTEGIAIVMQLSPKTIEYHRVQLMNRLQIFDLPGLTRFAIRCKLIQI